MITVTVDPEFQSLIPPLSSDEYEQLEKNVVADGCRDALVVWDGLLLDGHNRLRICEQHDVDFDVVEVDLPDRDAGKAWIIQNQLGRRNLQPFQRVELALLLEPELRARAKENLSVGGGDRKSDTYKSGCQTSDKAIEPVDTKKELAKAAGVSHDTIAKGRVIAKKADDKTKDMLRSGEITINAAYKNIQREEAREIIKERQQKQEVPDLPEGVYDVVLADPPWRYDFAPHTDGMSIEEHYPTMVLEDICALGDTLPVSDNAVLFLWATCPKLLEALEVMKAWGFSYKTNAVWDKQKVAGRGAWKSGYWFLGQHELLLVGVRGKFSPPDSDLRVPSVFGEKREKHSKKPVSVYETLETYFPLNRFRRLELFARQPRDGWTTWGNEI